MQLRAEEIALFRHNGFIKLPSLLSKTHVEGLKTAALKDVRDEIEPVSRQEGRVNRISNLWGRGGIFQETICSAQILDPLESLLGPNIEFLLNRHNHFYLRERTSAASLDIHRDVRQWSRTIVTVLVYLEDTNLENGCTHILPGSHLLPAFAERDKGDNLAIASRQMIPLPMPAGGLLAMDGLALHAVGKNQTDQTRMSITLGYHSVDEFSLPDEKRVLLRGERVYDGNDRNKPL